MKRAILISLDGLEEHDVVQLLVGRSLADVERCLIEATLERCGGNRTRAAATLGVTVRTLRNKLKIWREESHA